MSEKPWSLVTSDHPNPILAAIALVHEQINPMLLADGWSQDQADQVLGRISTDLQSAVRKAEPQDQGDVAKHFAIRCITEYRNGGHLTQ